MAQIVWRRVNDEPFEYAIQQGPHGDEFVTLLDGSCLRRSIDEDEMQSFLKMGPAQRLWCDFKRDPFWRYALPVLLAIMLAQWWLR